MLFQDITILNGNLEICEHQYVEVKEQSIVYIGDKAPEQYEGPFYDGRNKLLTSGFFNSHAHTPMTLLRGYGENMALDAWLNQRIFPFEAKLQAGDVYYATLLGIAEMLRYGTVSATDMYYFGDAMCRAFLDAGFKNNLSLGVTCFDDSSFQNLPLFQEYQDLLQTYQGAGDGKITIDMCIHAEYTSTPKVVREVGEYAKKNGLRCHIHLAETAKEQQECKERHNNLTPAAYFQSLGFFENPTTAAHCVWLEEEDFAILAENHVTVATCPVSNLKLASGVCNVAKLFANNVNVALGTDSVSSNNGLNMTQEMKFLALVQKGFQQDPTLVTPQQALMSATQGGALAQGRVDCGSLKVGNRADLVVWDLQLPQLQPVHDLRNNLVYSANGSEVVLTMIDGKILYENGQYPTIDLERVFYEVERSRQRILTELAD